LVVSTTLRMSANWQLQEFKERSKIVVKLMHSEMWATGQLPGFVNPSAAEDHSHCILHTSRHPVHATEDLTLRGGCLPALETEETCRNDSAWPWLSIDLSCGFRDQDQSDNGSTINRAIERPEEVKSDAGGLQLDVRDTTLKKRVSRAFREPKLYEQWAIPSPHFIGE